MRTSLEECERIVALTMNILEADFAVDLEDFGWPTVHDIAVMITNPTVILKGEKD